MQIAATIFIILGMIANFFVVWWLGVIGLIVGAFMLATLFSGRKYIVLGILGILFTGLLGGILYLCWTPENY
jgi:uncharacterized membrane protein HdeD (DUF308 family)